MAQVFSLDGTTINRIERADWRDNEGGLNLALIGTRGVWLTHIWQSSSMPMADYEVIEGKRESIVTLVTVSPSDRNGDYITYYEAVVRGVNYTSHDVRNASGVTAEFLVRV